MIQVRALRNMRAGGRGCALAALLLFHSPAAAEDEKSRWTFSFGGGVLSTQDDIRSNAAVVRLDDVGRTGDISDDVVDPASIDLRQDDLLGRETETEEAQTYNFAVAYGLTSWLSVQVDLGYYQGNVSNLDTLRINRRYVDINRDNQINPDTEALQTPLHDASVPISAGELRQIPLTFSAIFRFRKDSPFNPILGAGVGWVFTSLEESQVLADLNAEILQGFQRTQLFGSASNTQIIKDVHGNEVVNSSCALPANRLAFSEFACTRGMELLEDLLQQLKDEGTYTPELEEELRQTFAPAFNTEFIPTRPLVTTEVEDGFAYQFLGGAEYHFNEHWSVYMLGRYLATKAHLRIRVTDGGNLFTAQPTDPGLEEAQPVRFDLKEALFVFNAEGNLEGPTGGSPDLENPILKDEIYVQGGEINLSSFSLLFGLRFTF